MTFTTFGQWIKSRRKSLALTQDQLALQVNCSSAAIKKIEAGERRPSRQVAVLLAEHLQIPPEERGVFVQVARGELPLGRLPAPGVEMPAPAIPREAAKPAGMAAVPAPAPVRTALPLVRIPQPATVLIGRERELEKITSLLKDPQCRLLTLTGVGGVGKTSLAIQAAVQLQAVFPDGVYFSSLSGVDSPDFIVPAMASALDINFSGPVSPRQQLLQALRGKKILLVIDNLEHLLDGVDLFGEILQYAPGSKLLATSREQLHLQAEWVFEVLGLPVPHGDQEDALESNSAVKLFIQRARQVQNDFSLDICEMEAIGRICQLVQGLPLAIELAAKWTRTLSCAEIASEIETGLELLSSSRSSAQRDSVQRHRSIRTVFDHSWALLSPEEQLVLKRLSVFRGGFRRAASAQVAGANISILSALIDKSLLWHGEADRYHLHELVRQYLAAHLAEDPVQEKTTRYNHARCYLTLLETNEPVLRSRRQKDALAALDGDIDNIRLAWNTAVEDKAFDLLRTSAGPLYYYFELHQYFQDAQALFRQAADAVEAWHAAAGGSFNTQEKASLEGTLASLWNYQAFFQLRQGSNREALALFQKSLELLRPLQDPYGLAFALVHTGVVYWAMGDFPQAAAFLEEGLPLSAALGKPWLHALALGFLGGVSHDRGEYQSAFRLLQESVTLCQIEGDPEITTFMGIYYSRTLLVLNQLDAARRLLEEGLQNARGTGNRWLTALGLEYLARIARAEGQDSEAYRLMAESIQLHRDVRDQWSLSLGLIELSRLLLQKGDYDAAEQHAKEVLSIVAETGYTPIALEALSILAAVYARRGLAVESLTLIAHILQHPASKQDTRDQVEALRAEIAALSAEQWQAVQRDAQAETLEVFLNERYGIRQPAA